MPVNLISGGSPTPFPVPSGFNWTLGISLDTDSDFTGHLAKDVKFTNGVGIEYQKVFDTADATIGTPAYIVHEYSRRRAFNVPDVNGNSSRCIAFASDGWWYLYDINLDGNNDVTTLTVNHRVTAGMNEPWWHPTDPNKFWYILGDGVTLELYEWDCVLESGSIYRDWNTLIINADPTFSTAAGITMGTEGTLSTDGRYGCFMVQEAYDGNNFPYLGMVCIDIIDNTLEGVFPVGTLGRPNHTSMDPTGQFCVPSWGDRSGGPDGNGGAFAFSRDFSTSLRLSVNDGEHAGNVLGADGTPWHVSVEYEELSDIPGVTSGSFLYATNMITQQVNQFYFVFDPAVSPGLHISGECTDLPGYVVVSHFATSNRDGIYLLNIHDGTVRKIGSSHAQDIPDTGTGYYTQPHATISQSGKHVFSGSNADGTEVNPATYMFHIPHTEIPPAI